MIEAFTAALEIRRQAATGQYQVHGNVNTAQCVVGQSFGFTRNEQGIIQPGLANIALARYAINNLPELPKIFQFEIADAYSNAPGGSCTADYRIEKHRQDGKYLDTREVHTSGGRHYARKGLENRNRPRSSSSYSTH